MNIYFDTEFTGLHQKTTLISIGLISDCWETFYAEFTDYDKSQCNEWIQENVIDTLKFNDISNTWVIFDEIPKAFEIKANTNSIKEELTQWLSQFENIEIWSDCLSYDWVLFNDLIADYSNWYPELPKNINYIPFDICTLFKIKGINPDISREEFAEISDKTEKHNALFDAKIIKMCYKKLMK